MSRIVAGKIRLDVQPVEIPGVVDNAVLTIQPAADAKGVKLHTLIDPRVGPVAGDPDRLQQVVWNLLSNAVKFTSRGERVQVRLERVNSHLELIVSDTGAGIRPDFLPYVFERFRQADAGPTRKTGGLGPAAPRVAQPGPARRRHRHAGHRRLRIDQAGARATQPRDQQRAGDGADRFCPL